MNQILVTEKLYITPELKRKKKIYKFNFIISIFLVFVLTSIYIYAEYDRNKSEATSKQILDTNFKECLTDEQIAWITKHYGSFDEFEEYFKQFATIITFDDDIISVDDYLKAMQDGGVI